MKYAGQSEARRRQTSLLPGAVTMAYPILYISILWCVHVPSLYALELLSECQLSMSWLENSGKGRAPFLAQRQNDE